MSTQANANPIGYRFVQQYYHSLNTDPTLVGQEAINDKITSLGMKDCKADIKQVDCQQISDEFILIQVIGWLSNDNAPMRKFCQSFCLQKVEMNGNLSVRYAICNDVFRYLAEPADVPAEDETAPIEAATPTVVPTEDAPEAPSDATVDAPPPAAPAAVVEEATPTEEVSTGASDDGAAAGSEATPASVVEPVVAGGGDEGVPEVAPVAAVAAPAPSAPVAPVGDTAAPVPKAPFSYANAAGKVKPAAPPAAAPSSASGPAATPVPIGTPADGPGGMQRPRGNGPRATGNGHVAAVGVLHVRNLPSKCTAGDLFAMFQAYGTIRETPKYGITIQVNKPPSKNSNQPAARVAFVEFEDDAAVALCLQDAESGKEFELHGQRLQVERQKDVPRGPGRGNRFGGRGGFGRGHMRGGGGHRGNRGGGGDGR